MAGNYSIKPKRKILILQIILGPVSYPTPNHVVFNIGRTPVKAETICGTTESWKKVLNSCVVLPGERKVIDNFGRRYFRTGLKISNLTNTRAIVFASTEQYGNSFRRFNAKDEIYRILREIINKGARYLTIIKTCYLFDPPFLDVLFDDMILTVSLIGDNAGIGVKLTSIKARCDELRLELRREQHNAATMYMDIAQDLIELERGFNFQSRNADEHNDNLILITVYSFLFRFKIIFYCPCKRTKEYIGLTTNEVLQLNEMAKVFSKQQEGILKTMNDIYNGLLKKAYEKGKPHDIYDLMMGIRTCVAVCGLEYFAPPKEIRDPNIEDVYNTIISYSEFFGRQTPELGLEATREEMAQPLTPKLIDGKRNKMVSLDLYMSIVNPLNGVNLKIMGLKVTFENGDSYIMGTTSPIIEKIDFNGAYLCQLDVTGD